MRKSIKRAFASVIALVMATTSLAIPTMADTEYTPLVEGDTVLNEWKFDFGTADNVADGYTAVTADRNYVTSKDYGFIGIDEDSYKLGNRYDGFGNQKGQVIELKAGGNGEENALYDGIGSVGEDMYGNSGEKYYPTRFALKVQDEQYFRVKATVTTLDPSKDATISLYTERKHPIVKNKTVKAGEAYTVEFSVRTTPIYYEKSTPKGSIADEMVNVAVLGENSALAALEIQQVESLPVMWVLGDSTVTDGNCALPFFEQQNYTGVGTGLTMYLPRDMAMVNEGEGGLAAGDNNHFNMVKNRIKEGDYMYVEYGHNHKDDDPTGYVKCLDKYYDACKAVNAKLLIVSPIERINTFTDGAYQQTLNGFADAGEAYVAEKVAAGANDIAYVDLNDLSIKWYNEITTDNNGDANAIKYYFQTAKGRATDRTHPNDKGAEWLAYKFMQAAQLVTDEAQKAVVDGFLTGMTEEAPTLVSEEITAGGVGGDAWPTYIVPTDNKYPVVIKDIVLAEDGTVKSADVEVQQAEFAMTAYGIIIITVLDENGAEKGKIYAVDQVDNSTGYGPQKIVNFKGDVTIGETDTYTAVVMQALDTGDGLKLDEEANKAYSAVYTPSEIAEHLITDEDGNGGEDFDFYGAVYEGDSPSKLTEGNSWSAGGSAGQDITLGISGETKYTNLVTDGAKNGSANQGSFYVWKNLEKEIGTTGRYMISADFKYVSGGGMEFNLKYGVSDKVLWGTDGLTAFAIGSNGVVTAGGLEAGTVSGVNFTNVKWVLDMDRATATITVGGGDPVEYTVSNYATSETTITPAKLTSFQAALNKAACAVQMSNLVVAKLKDTKLPEKALTIGQLYGEEEWGTTSIVPLPTAEPTAAPTVVPTAEPTVAPTVVPTAEPTVTPKETVAPNTTEEPKETVAPNVTVAPKETAAPKETEAPETVALMDNSNGVTLTYSDGKVVVKSDKALKAVVLEAVFNDDGSLDKINITNVEFSEAGEKSVDAASGSKIMVWDSLESAKPLAESAAVPTIVPTTIPTTVPTVEPTVVPTVKPTATPFPMTITDEISTAINTVVTVKAEAKDGYVFMGWKNTKDVLVSEDTEYTFRLHDDTVLYADFAKEPGVDDVVNYSLAAENAFVKAEEGSTTTMMIVDPVDDAGTPLLKVNNSDAKWSCEETGITVDENGVVTVGADFAIDAGTTKDVKIKAVLNGVERTYTITLYSYEYYENMTEGSTDFDGLFKTIGGKTAIVFPGGADAKQYKMASAVSLDKATTVKFAHAWSGANTCGQYRTLNFKDSSGNTIFSMHYEWGGLFVGSTELKGAVSKDTWTDVTVEIDPTTSVVKVTVNGTSAETTLASGAADIAGIELNSAKSAPGPEARALGIANVTIIQ